MTSKNEMINKYEQYSVADKYIIGFEFKKAVYMVEMNKINNELLTVEVASRNCGDNLRLRVRKNNKIEMLEKAIEICKAEDLIDTIGHETKGKMKFWNRGEMFEKAVTEYYGQNWEKDTVPFWEDGDLNVKGEKIQIKYDSATLTSTKQLTKLEMEIV